MEYEHGAGVCPSPIQGEARPFADWRNSWIGYTQIDTDRILILKLRNLAGAATLSPMSAAPDTREKFRRQHWNGFATLHSRLPITPTFVQRAS